MELKESPRVQTLSQVVHQQQPQPAKYDDAEDEEGDDFETAISATGYGFFHYWLLVIGGFANASDAIEILCVSILLPAAQCDLNMTTSDKGWLSSIVFFGMMAGGYIWGCLGDIYGRRNVLIVSLLVNALAGILSSFAQSFPLFLFFRFTSGLGVGGSIPLVWAYISEFQPANKRGGALSVIAAFWMVGNILVAVFAVAIIPYDIGFVSPSFSYNSWRIFLTVCALPAFITAILMLWLPESPMYLLLRGRHDETIAVLQEIFAQNKRMPPTKYPIVLINPSGLRVQATINQGFWKSFKKAFSLTFHQTNALFGRSLLRITVIMLLINFAIQFGYYGLWLWFPELFNRLEQFYNDHPDDRVSVCKLTNFQGNNTIEQSPCESNEPAVDPKALLNTLITAVAPLPTNLWTIFYMDSLGRKFFLVFSMVLSGCAAFGVYFVKTATDNLILGCVFGAVSTMGFNALDCLGAELFPTHLRSTALAVTLLAARIGAILGNVVFGYLVDVYCAIPLFMVAFLLIGGGLLGLLLPNMTRKSLT
ncbi:synaptic vesicle glycoprotein 2B isoform X1 [Procambarus clarkii]|uniref:synaptic vesicle glycoprotein 2B isoform X1 n=1 Tax=Procambarus clarkii TaxID=6728 RepID=UPI0037442EAF